MIVPNKVHKVGDSVVSAQGMRGEVTKVLEHRSGRTYVVKWENGHEGRVSPHDLRVPESMQQFMLRKSREYFDEIR